MPIALLIEVIEIVNVQPLAGKLRGQSPNSWIVQHASSLRDQGVGVGESAGRRDPLQLGIRQRRPQKLA